MKHLRETREIFASNLRELAIREQWFTKATNEQYEQWFKILEKGDHGKYSVDKLLALSVLVMRYSDLDSDMTVEDIAYLINLNCVSSFFEFERE